MQGVGEQHPGAQVAPEARLGADVEIAPGAVVHEGVELGAGSRVGSGAVLHAGSKLGDGCLIEDGASREGHAQLVLRFFSFYPSHQKTLARGNRVRVFGEVRDGHYGLEIVHPQFKVVSDATPLANRLTPVYPTTAGLSQDTLRKIAPRKDISA